MTLHTLAIDSFRLALWLFILCIVFIPLERLFTRQTERISRAQLFKDLALYFINGLLPAALMSLPVAFIARLSAHITPPQLSQSVAQLPLIISFIAVFLIGEITFYWAHRLCHQIPLLWRFHALHHSAEHIHFLVNTRAHPADIIFTRLFSIIPMYLLGFAGQANQAASPMLVIFIGVFWGFFLHANIRWRFGFIEKMIATPAYHHWHHNQNEKQNVNFASMLPCLDLLFGSYFVPKVWPKSYGLAPVTTSTLSNDK
ncbi:sterol desaturase family protein [Iodobacter fluviatilis]|uniref:Fatty acid hydroxylase superfamily n=1 Tax=Iodobacter fluviatilis TaxID=537 RepID=A0A377QAN8_9NEIS|nr:sterol desaturase family protein [Iodobacter fluviatilis]TCU81780.1 sterol desaturase/sphingolipid hydroxylase (fatty acid hydroxylase superfamily) [Iodobacter fluviatilis]STQ91887.1 Fatty acid hydroxylase superfamily [Iodobacter fluviatilis]